MPTADPPVALFSRLQWQAHKPVDYDALRGASYRRLNEARERIMPGYLDPKTGRFKDELVVEANCRICTKNSFTELFWKEGLRFVQCDECALIQVNPLPIEKVSNDFYASETYDQIMREHVVEKVDYRRNRFGTERVDAWERFLGPPSSSEPRSVLDVGCADGFVLEAAHERGWSCHGVDLNPAAVEAARAKGLDVRLSRLEDCDFVNGSLDVVSMYDLLEHVREPMPMLRRAANLLRPGGLLVIYVPNYDCLERLILGPEVFLIWGIFHLSYFTPATLARAAGDAGFRVDSVETHGMDVANLIWREEHRGQRRDMTYLRDNREKLQFVVNASGWGSFIRLYAVKP